uniref:ARF7 effector protein C-terminal domain-containing protein n=1 Tax=Acanthochromis polyacanthus TaxID=80966 RepID=A0A3Q1GPE5_9TELE
MGRAASYYLCFSTLSASPNGICLKLNNSSIKRQVRNKKLNTEPFSNWRPAAADGGVKRMSGGKKNSRRREKRGSTGARQRWQFLEAKSRVNDSKDQLLSEGKDMCNCLDVDCRECFDPCPDCRSRKCGVECHCDRKWLYEQIEVEGGEVIQNKFAG